MLVVTPGLVVLPGNAQATANGALANERKAKNIRVDRCYAEGSAVGGIWSAMTEAFRVTNSWYDGSDIPGLYVSVNFIDFDGDRLGTRKMDLFINKYSAHRELTDLEVMPLELEDDADEIRAELLERGRKFESYIGDQHYLQYKGLAIKKLERGYARFDVNGRVMVDVKTFHRLEANDSFNVKTLPYDKAAKEYRLRRKALKDNFAGGENPRQYDKLSDEDACLTNATIRGYSFGVKKFLEFFVDQLSDIEWNENCFDELVLDAGTKKTVQALVSNVVRACFF